MTITDVRLRTRLSDELMEQRAGKVLGGADYDVLLHGPTYVRKPDGSPLLVYLPRALATVVDEPMREVLYGIQMRTDNRGNASGSKRKKIGEQKRSRTLNVPSGILGAMDAVPAQPYCRLTSWTGQHLEHWRELEPLFSAVAHAMEAWVKPRYDQQMQRVRETDPAWVIPGTPFTTVTVNNTYATGLHTDKGDLPQGFSTLATLRRGAYTGGILVFAQYRVAVDMQDCDLLLMDAHEWHGNTAIAAQHIDGCDNGPIHQTDTSIGGPFPEAVRHPGCAGCKAERVSLVAYYRTAVQECGDPEEEAAKARAAAEARSN